MTFSIDLILRKKEEELKKVNKNRTKFNLPLYRKYKNIIKNKIRIMEYGGTAHNQAAEKVILL